LTIKFLQSTSGRIEVFKCCKYIDYLADTLTWIRWAAAVRRHAAEISFWFVIVTQLTTGNK